LLELNAPTLQELGRQLGAAYGERIKAGMSRSRELYVKSKPITCDEKRWGILAESAAAGARQCCPHAAAFFDGISEGMGGDAYMALLDFELYMLEVQRQLDVKAAAKDERETAIKVLAHCQAQGNKEGIRVATKALALSERRAAEVATSSSEDESSSGDSSSESSDDEDGEMASEETEDEDLTKLLVCREPVRTMSTDTKAGRQEGGKAGRQVRGMQNGRCTGFAVSHEGVAVRSDGSGGGGGSALLAQTVELPLSLYGFGDLDLVMKLATTGGDAATTGGGTAAVPVKVEGQNASADGVTKGVTKGVDPKHAHKVMCYDCDGRLCPVGLNEAGLGVCIFNLHQGHKVG
jgi:hypothetical protein